MFFWYWLTWVVLDKRLLPMVYVAVIDILCMFCLVAAGEKELPLSYLFVDNNDDTGSDATALIYKLHTSDTIKCVKQSISFILTSNMLILSDKVKCGEIILNYAAFTHTVLCYRSTSCSLVSVFLLQNCLTLNYISFS